MSILTNIVKFNVFIVMPNNNVNNLKLILNLIFS